MTLADIREGSAYADIVAVVAEFHWPPSEIERMSLDDLSLYAEIARRMHET